MADDKDKPKGKKYLDKFDDDAQLVAAYQELEKRLGSQGDDLGKHKKDLEAALAQIGQYTTYLKKANPIIEWYAANEAAIQQAFGADGKPKPAATPASATSTDLLTPGEKEALAQFIGDRVKSTLFDPWVKQLEGTIQKYADGAQGNLGNQLKAHTDVMWRTLQYMLGDTEVGKGRIDQARKWHEEALKLSDPSKFDPMEVSREFLSLRAERDLSKKQIEDLTTKVSELEKKATPSVGSGPPPSFFARPEDKPTETREERMAAAVDAVKTEHGLEGVKTLFPEAAR